MNKHVVVVASASLAVGAVIIAGAAAGFVGSDTSQNSPSQAVSDRLPVAADDTSLAAGVVPAATPDLPCVATATPTLSPGTDQRILDALKSNWASQADPPRAPMTRTDAVEAARAMSSLAQQAGLAGTELAPESMPAAAVRAPYQAAEAWIGGSVQENSLVAPQRCVWVVTVDAPFTPRSAPPGVTVKPYPSYTTMFDGRSGQYLGVSAGVDAANLISGERLTGN